MKTLIKGLGIDLIEVLRLKNALDRYGEKLLSRLFTEKEISYCCSHAKKEIHLAGRFAAKEAIVKALGVGFGEKISWKDIEILPDNMGKPIVVFSKKIKTSFDDPHIILSISHTRHHATAVALWQ